MKFIVVVTVLVTCGPASYNLIFRNGGKLLLYDQHHVGYASWFIWMPGSEPRLEDGDEFKRDEEHNQFSLVGSLLNETTSLKRSYMDELIPTTPGDNSHYVEGQSRYIWMPDGDGTPRLVDLLAMDERGFDERSVADTEYWLYTRRNPLTHQELILYQADSIHHSNFKPDRPITVTVHGWLSDGHDGFSTLMKNTFLSAQDANFIVVDWRNLAKTGYGTSVQTVPEVGQHIATFLTWLIEASGASWNNVHLIGFSLGAHIAGSAGRFAEGRPGRITGLDPAGPLFHGNPDNLSPIDGQYVEVIHTDGDRLGHFGHLGQADFYVNGGRNPQPGCFISTCSHSRVVELFAATVRFNHLTGNRCGDIIEAERAACNGHTMKMGNADLTKRGRGIFGVTTDGSWPY